MKEIEIPEGYEAKIDGNKVILVPKESEDEKIRKAIIRLLQNGGYMEPQDKEKAFAWLKKQKEQKPYEPKNWPADKDNLTQEQKPAEWGEDDGKNLYHTIEAIKYTYEASEDGGLRLINWLKSHLRPQPSGNLAISFMNYLDGHRPEGKMCLSNGECADIETAFKKEDWAKVIRYVNKYQPHWKPSEEQMEALKDAFRKDGGNEYRKVINSLYRDLEKLL